MNIPYPAAPQTAVLLDGQSGQTILCESCDPNGRRDAEIEGYRLLLTGTSVLVYQAEDCSLHETLTLDCAPRSLWPSSREHRVYVICNSTPKYMEINYRFDSDPETADFHPSRLLPPSASDASAPTNGTFISGDISDGLNKEDYFVWIEDGLLHVYEAYGSRLLSPEGFSAEAFDIDCDTLIEVYARNEDMSGNPRFLLNCTKNDAQRLYDFELHSGQSPRELQPLAGPPIESPDGEFLVVVSQSRTSLAVYRTSDTSQNVPKTVSGVIEEARFDQSGTLIVVVRGKDIKLVNVELFFSSGGADGETSLPGSAANCPGVGRCLPHGFVQEGWYLVMTAAGSVYEGRVYNLTDSSWTVGSISGRPEAASFLMTSSIPTSSSPTSTPSTSTESPTSTADSSPSVSFDEKNRKRSPPSAGEVAAIVVCSVIVLLLIITAIVMVVFRKTISHRLQNAKYSCLKIQKPVDQLPEDGRRPPLTGASDPGQFPIQATADDDSQLYFRSDANSLTHHHASSSGRNGNEDSTALLLPGSGDSSVASSRHPTPIPPHRGDTLTNPGSTGAEDDRRSESSPDGLENGTPPPTVAAATAISNGQVISTRNLLSSDVRSELGPSRAPTFPRTARYQLACTPMVSHKFTQSCNSSVFVLHITICCCDLLTFCYPPTPLTGRIPTDVTVHANL